MTEKKDNIHRGHRQRLKARFLREGIDGFDETYASDRNKILLVGVLRIIFSHYVGHKTKVVEYELFSRAFIAFCGKGEIFALLIRCERGWEALRRGYPEDKMKKVGEHRKNVRQHDNLRFLLDYMLFLPGFELEYV